MKISKKIVYVVFGIIIILLVGYFFIPGQKGDEEETSESSSTMDYGKLDEVIFTVQTTKVIKGDLVKNISANGIVKAKQELETLQSTVSLLTYWNQ